MKIPRLHIKKKIIFILSIIFILISTFINPIIYTIYENDLISTLKSTIYNNYFQDIYFSKEDNNSLIINTTDNFDKQEFNDMYEIIKNINSIVSNLVLKYKPQTIYLNLDTPNVKKILICCNDNIYYYDNLNLYKNNTRYELKDNLKEHLYSKFILDDTDNSILNYLDEIYDVNTLQNLLSIEDLNQCKNEIVYIVAKKYYDKDNYSSAKELLEKLNGYKDSNELLISLNNIHKFDGKWYGKFPNTTDKTTSGLSAISQSSHNWIFSGNKCYLIYNTYNKINTYDEYYNEIENDVIYIYDKKENIGNRNNVFVTMNYDNNELKYEHRIFKSEPMSIHKTDSDTMLPTTKIIPEPSIGMTPEEVRKSTWGSPDKINKDTYSWGTSEQWVYKDGKYSNKYIYFKNGYVSSISE